MELQTKQVELRKLTAGEGKIIVSKSLNEEEKPVVKAKEIYLAVGDTADNYYEIDDEEI